MICAAFVEIRRRNASLLKDDSGNILLSSCNSPMSNLSVFNQIPQYILVGTGEILTSVPGQ